jgi:hypothetical protein
MPSHETKSAAATATATATATAAVRYSNGGVQNTLMRCGLMLLSHIALVHA